jgi:solute carrier family 15 oligopeptide transporter 1
VISAFKYLSEKSENGRTRLYLMIDPASNLIGEHLFVLDQKNQISASTEIKQGANVNIQPAFFSSPDYTIVYGVGCSVNHTDCEFKKPFFAQMGSAHVINLSADPRGSEDFSTAVVRPNSINMLWQLPQFLVITVGEILFSVTGPEFSYSQSAPSMKSVVLVSSRFFIKIHNCLVSLVHDHFLWESY